MKLRASELNCTKRVLQRTAEAETGYLFEILKIHLIHEVIESGSIWVSSRCVASEVVLHAEMLFLALTAESLQLLEAEA